MDSIVQAVLENSRLMPDKTAIAVDDKKITYRELAEKITIFSGSLLMYSVRKGSRIAIESDDLISYFAAFLGCQLSGMIAVPIEENISIYKLQDILKATKPALVFMKNNGERYADFLKGTAAHRISYPKSSATAAIIATTGTTGKPVLVTHTNRSLSAEAENLSRGTGITSGTVLFANVPFNLALGYRRVFAALCMGATAVLTHKPLTADLLSCYIERFHINYVTVLNTNVNLILDTKDPKFVRSIDLLNTVETVSGPVTSLQIHSFHRQHPGVSLYHVYGTTESGCVLIHDTSKNPVEGCLGKPAIHAELAVIDENGERVTRPNQYGYIAVKGSMNMTGYYHKKALTEKVMHSDFIVLNDIGYFDFEGYYYFVSRVGDIININGHKITPGEIEQAVSGYEGIADCACAALEDQNYIQAPVLYIVCQDACFDLEKLQDYLKQHLEPYKIPGKIIPVSQIPRTATGKVMRQSLSIQKKRP